MTDVAHYGTGKRKTAIARVYLHMGGKGEILVNQLALDKYFTVERCRTNAASPLHLTGTAGSLDVRASVRGGGPSSQADAVRHGIARALVLMNPELRDKLKKAGFLTRDAREKERKKYGQPGARKRFQYSKR